MKAQREHLHSGFQIKHVKQARFDAPYHFHPELELTLKHLRNLIETQEIEHGITC